MTGYFANRALLTALIPQINQIIAKNAWEAESVCSLLEIFKLTEEKELRKIFNKLTENLKTE